MACLKCIAYWMHLVNGSLPVMFSQILADFDQAFGKIIDFASTNDNVRQLLEGPGPITMFAPINLGESIYTCVPHVERSKWLIVQESWFNGVLLLSWLAIMIQLETCWYQYCYLFEVNLGIYLDFVLVTRIADHTAQVITHQLVILSSQDTQTRNVNNTFEILDWKFDFVH